MTEKWKTVDDLYEEFYGKKTTDARRSEILQNLTVINHPKYYGGGDNPYEAVKVIEAWQLDFNLGNVVKYISRFAS